MAGESTPTLQATGISKAFGATQALKDVDFLIYPGERVAVMGENGAGKSTLMKVFAGVHTPDSGVMHLGGDPYRPHLPNAAIAAGVSTVYQEPSGFGHLTVLENIFMGRQRTGRFGVLDRRTMQREAEEVLETLELPSAVLGREMRRLALAEQQQVLIARAVMRKARVLILDEPTSILTSAEANRLFDLIDRLAAGDVDLLHHPPVRRAGTDRGPVRRAPGRPERRGDEGSRPARPAGDDGFRECGAGTGSGTAAWAGADAGPGSEW